MQEQSVRVVKALEGRFQEVERQAYLARQVFVGRRVP
jgi:hypothetical protein